MWDGTCAVTHLPIKKDQPVRLILLVSQAPYLDFGGGFCNATQLAVPQFLSIKGIYNDYGCIVPKEDWQTANVVDCLNLWLKEKSIEINKTDGSWSKGTNPCQYPTIGNWLNAIERGYVYRLEKDDAGHRQPEVGQFQFMLVHEDIYQLAVNMAQEWQQRGQRDYCDTISDLLSHLAKRRKVIKSLPVKERKGKLWFHYLREGLEISEIFNTGDEYWEHHL